MQRLNPVPAVPAPQNPYSQPYIELQDPRLWESAPKSQLQPITAEHKCTNGFYGCYCDDSGNQFALGRYTGSLPPIISAIYRVPPNTLPGSSVPPSSP